MSITYMRLDLELQLIFPHSIYLQLIFLIKCLVCNVVKKRKIMSELPK